MFTVQFERIYIAIDAIEFIDNRLMTEADKKTIMSKINLGENGTRLK